VPYKPEMEPEQVAMWIVHQETKFTNKKISKENIELTRECYITYKVTQDWENIKDSFIGLEGEDFTLMLEKHNSILESILYEAVKIDPAAEEELQIRFDNIKSVET